MNLTGVKTSWVARDTEATVETDAEATKADTIDSVWIIIAETESDAVAEADAVVGADAVAGAEAVMVCGPDWCGAGAFMIDAIVVKEDDEFFSVAILLFMCLISMVISVICWVIFFNIW